MKKLLLLILCMALALALASCGGGCEEHIDSDKNGKCDECGETVEVVCTEHKDEDDDVLCDICGEVYVKPVATVDVNVVLRDQDEVVIAGVEVTLTKSGSTPVKGTTDADGKFTATLEVGRYAVSYEYNSEEIGFFIPDTTDVLVGENTTGLELNMINNTPNGTLSRPYIIYAGEENSFTIPVGGTCYYVAYHAVGMLVDVNSADVKVVYGEAEYLPEEDKIHFALLAEDTNSAEVFEIVNTSDDEITFTVDMYSRPGTHGNPHKITDLTAAITTTAINNKGIVYYSYTATVAGTFTLTLDTANAYAAMMNLSNSETESTASAESATISLEVGEGEEILIDLSTSSATAIEITFSVAFAPAE